jgi:hypothetical protein
MVATSESNQSIEDVGISIPLEFMYQTKIAITICKIIESGGQAKEQTKENQENGMLSSSGIGEIHFTIDIEQTIGELAEIKALPAKNMSAASLGPKRRYITGSCRYSIGPAAAEEAVPARKSTTSAHHRLQLHGPPIERHRATLHAGLVRF